MTATKTAIIIATICIQKLKSQYHQEEKLQYWVPVSANHLVIIDFFGYQIPIDVPNSCKILYTA